MSSVYALEPQTKGHAVLNTTHGPIDLFLWSVEAPLASRNFIQHALNGYYNGLPFHRIIPDVLAQTGDPSRTGTGGEPAIGDLGGFAREVHGRLKFRRRGIAAMVADDSGKVRSQFFITLRQTEWLDGQHTIFGCIQGDSIYNFLNLAAFGKVDGFDIENVPRLKSITIVVNPFPDIVAKLDVSVKKGPDDVKQALPTAKRAVKSKGLLSFGDDADSTSDEDVRCHKQPRDARDASVNCRRMRASGITKSPMVFGKEGPEKQEETESHSKELQAGRNVSSGRQKVENAEVIRQANEEFERLKAELMGTDGAPQKNATSTVSDAEKTTTASGQTGIQKSAAGLSMSRASRWKRDEGETLRRMKAFENRLISSRQAAGRMQDRKQSGAAWFSQGLKLGTQVMEEDEYEVRVVTNKKRRGTGPNK